MSWDPGGMSWYGRQSVRAEQPTSRETSGSGSENGKRRGERSGARSEIRESAYQQPLFPITALEGDNPRHRAHGLPVQVQNLSELLVPQLQAIQTPA